MAGDVTQRMLITSVLSVSKRRVRKRSSIKETEACGLSLLSLSWTLEHWKDESIWTPSCHIQWQLGLQQGDCNENIVSSTLLLSNSWVIINELCHAASLSHIHKTQQHFFNYTPLMSNTPLKLSKHEEKQRNPKEFHCHSFANMHTVFSLRLSIQRPDIYKWISMAKF